MNDQKRIGESELRLLSRLFSYPEKGPELSDIERIGSAWGAESGAEALTALQNEYVRLFINALPEVPCPPYGSLYLSGSLMDASTVQLKNLYSSYGFVAEDMADHIAVELEFLALLSLLSDTRPVEEDYRFLLQHLEQWTPELLSQVEQNDTTGFYRDLSKYAGKVLAAAAQN